MNPKAPDANEAEIPFMKQNGGNNGFRAHPGLTNEPNVPCGKPDISLASM